MKNIIKVSKLSKQFRSRGNKSFIGGIFRPNWQYNEVVKGITFAIDSGESVAFLGPNGAGKTTTTKMLTGLIKPSTGHVEVLGYEPFARNPHFLKQIGLVMGNKSGLNWDLSASQSFELLQKIYEIPMAKYTEQRDNLVGLLGVGHIMDTQIRRVSLGERMKLELIGSLLHDPKVLFLDEPTIGLDIESKHKIRTFLREIHGMGKTLLLTSHDMDDIAEVCDRVITINHGEILYDGGLADLTVRYSGEKFVKLKFKDVPNINILTKFGRVIKQKETRVTIAIVGDDVMKYIAQIDKLMPIHDISIEAVPLEIIVNDLFHKE